MPKSKYTGHLRSASPDWYAILKENARKNRNNMTVAEQVLWDELKGKKLGHRFYRQHIIADYIVDFMCHDDGLIIEIDGGYHSEPSQQESDQARTERLEALGYRVIRFTNEEVLYNLDEVLAEIINQLQ